MIYLKKSIFVCCIIFFINLSCNSFQNLFREKKTCLVLSVGGAKGLAHIGVIDALIEKGIKIDCVYGNSMGSVIGSLFASEPNENLRKRYALYIAEYINVTKSYLKKQIFNILTPAQIGQQVFRLRKHAYISSQQI